MLSQLNKETHSDKGTHHSYIDMYYEETLANYKDKTITLLEIGVNAGRSLELWAKYFNESSTIIGVDKKMTIPYKPSKKNMRYIIGDATKEETIKNSIILTLSLMMALIEYMTNLNLLIFSILD